MRRLTFVIMVIIVVLSVAAAFAQNDPPPPRPTDLYPYPGGQYGFDHIYIGSDINQVMTYPNVADPNRVKKFWMEVTMSSSGSFPMGPNDWPVIEATGSAVTNVQHFQSYPTVGPWKFWVTCDIFPQPVNETSTFPDAWWTLNRNGFITSVEVNTVCIPEPSSVATVMAGFMGLCSYALRRRKRV